MQIERFLTLGLIAIAGSTQVWAQDPCRSLKECQDLREKVYAKINALLPKDVLFPPMLTDLLTVGSYDQYSAEFYCRKRGMNLPTIRQLALVAQSLGAQGIRESKVPLEPISSEDVQTEISQMNKIGFEPIYEKTPFGEIRVDFYFNNNGYKKPAGHLGGNLFFWSLSLAVNPKNPEDTSRAYGLHAQAGVIGTGTREDGGAGNAIRCVQ